MALNLQCAPDQRWQHVDVLRWLLTTGTDYSIELSVSVWEMMKHCFIFQDAPYLLEPLAVGFSDEEVPVRLALLTAALKLFFARPPECQALLGAALAAAVADANQDVRDRGLMYYRCVTQRCSIERHCTEAQLP